MAKLNEPNPFDDDDSNMPLRQVTLESVAEYLRCEPERLAKALRRLAETPSAVAYGPGESAWPGEPDRRRHKIVSSAPDGSGY